MPDAAREGGCGWAGRAREASRGEGEREGDEEELVVAVGAAVSACVLAATNFWLSAVAFGFRLVDFVRGAARTYTQHWAQAFAHVFGVMA